MDDLLPEKQTRRPDQRGAFPDLRTLQMIKTMMTKTLNLLLNQKRKSLMLKVMIRLNLQLIGKKLKKRKERQSTFVNMKPLEKKKGNVGRKKLVNLLLVQLLQ